MENESSVWQDIFKALKAGGMNVYSPGIKSGECTEPYIVVKNDGSNAHLSFSTDVDLYAIMCYVPKQEYSKLEPYVQETKKLLKGLSPKILPYGQQTPSFYDDSVKAHMISIEYKNYKKKL